MDSQKWREYSQHRAFPLSAGYWLEAVKLERTERLLAGKFDLATCTTQGRDGVAAGAWRERADRLVSQRRRRGVLQALGHGLRAGPGHVHRAHGLLPEPAGGDALLRRRVCRHLQSRRPGTRFEIVGADPSQEIRELGQAAGRARSPAASRTCGRTSPARRSRLRRSRSRAARRTRSSSRWRWAFQSSAAGRPRAAWMRFRASTCWPTTRASSRSRPSCRFWVRRELRERLAAAGRARVLSNHSWPSSMQRLDALIASQFQKRVAA